MIVYIGLLILRDLYQGRKVKTGKPGYPLLAAGSFNICT